MTDVGQAERAMGLRPYRGVREDVVTKPGIAFDPPGVQQRAGGNAERRVQIVTDEATTRTGRESAKAR